MTRRCMLGIAALLVAEMAVAQRDGTATFSDRTEDPAVEVILVTGEQPGPALWKVASGDHVLWIMGEASPLPARVKWRSKRFENLLANSQEVLLEVGEMSADKRQAARLRKLQTLPKGQELQAVSPPELYARVEAATRTFGTPESIEELQPWYATNRIAMSAMKSLDVMLFSARFRVEKLARDASVRVTYIDSPRQSVDEFIGNLEHGSSVPCLEWLVEILEDGGSGARRLANAWSTGAIGELRLLVPLYAWANANHEADKCTAVAYGGEQRANDFIARRTESWISEASRALQENRSTMAVVPMAELFAPDGYLAGLRAMGFEVTEPD